MAFKNLDFSKLSVPVSPEERARRDAGDLANSIVREAGEREARIKQTLRLRLVTDAESSIDMSGGSRICFRGGSSEGKPVVALWKAPDYLDRKDMFDMFQKLGSGVEVEVDGYWRPREWKGHGGESHKTFEFQTLHFRAPGLDTRATQSAMLAEARAAAGLEGPGELPERSATEAAGDFAEAGRAEVERRKALVNRTLEVTLSKPAEVDYDGRRERFIVMEGSDERGRAVKASYQVPPDYSEALVHRLSQDLVEGKRLSLEGRWTKVGDSFRFSAMFVKEPAAPAAPAMSGPAAALFQARARGNGR